MLTYEKYALARDAKGLSDYKMSALTGISKTTFSAWKSNGYTPKLETMLKIAKVLGLPPRELVSRYDIKNAPLVGDEEGI